MHFACTACLGNPLCVHFACARIYTWGNNQGIVLSWLTLVFRFSTIFKRSFGARFCKTNEHLWCHMNEEMSDFHTPTFKHETGVVIDVLHTSYCLCVFLDMIDELFYIFKKLWADNFDVQCVVMWEILQIVSCHCTEWCGSEKQKENMLGDAYPCVDFRDKHGLECLAWAIYDHVFIPGNKPALSGYHEWDCIIVGTLIHLIYQGQVDEDHCSSCV